MFDTIPIHSPFVWVCIAAVTVFSSARIARLLAFDHYPPAEWLRERWDRVTGASGWNLLLHCAFCLPPYTALGVLVWGYLTDWNLVWWLINGWLAASYASTYVVVYDGDDDD